MRFNNAVTLAVSRIQLKFELENIHTTKKVRRLYSSTSINKNTSPFFLLCIHHIFGKAMAQRRLIVVLAITAVLLVSQCVSVRVRFCSGIDLSGTCATKNVEIGMFRTKCEDFPWRFRWIFTARSVKVEGSFFTGCHSVCRLHKSDR